MSHFEDLLSVLFLTSPVLTKDFVLLASAFFPSAPCLLLLDLLSLVHSLTIPWNLSFVKLLTTFWLLPSISRWLVSCSWLPSSSYASDTAFNLPTVFLGLRILKLSLILFITVFPCVCSFLWLNGFIDHFYIGSLQLYFSSFYLLFSSWEFCFTIC